MITAIMITCVMVAAIISRVLNVHMKIMRLLSTVAHVATLIIQKSTTLKNTCVPVCLVMMVAMMACYKVYPIRGCHSLTLRNIMAATPNSFLPSSG